MGRTKQCAYCVHFTDPLGMSKYLALGKHSKLKIVVIALAAATVILICGLVILRVTQHYTGPKLITHSTDKPSESKDEANNYRWQGSPHDPKKIILETLSVDAYIQRMGVDQNNEIAVPTNIHLAGWFAESSQPGQKGLAIISGHVSGLTSPGVFDKLDKLQPKDRFQIIRGDDSKLEYEVLATKTLRESDAVAAIFSQDPSIKSQVNLVTCTGTFNSETSRYDKRIVVSAQLTE